MDYDASKSAQKSTKSVTFGSRTQPAVSSSRSLTRPRFHSRFRHSNMAARGSIMSSQGSERLCPVWRGELYGKQHSQASPQWWMRQRGWKVKKSVYSTEGSERRVEEVHHRPPLKTFVTRLLLYQRSWASDGVFSFHMLLLDLLWFVDPPGKQGSWMRRLIHLSITA